MSTDTLVNGFTLINPSTEDEIKEYEYMTMLEAEKVVENCHAAFRDWRLQSLEHRANIIKNIGTKLGEHKDEFVRLMTDEMGKTRKQGAQEIDLCIATCEYTAQKGQEILKDEERDLPEGGKGVISYSPTGVIYGIQPWNFPAYQAVRYSIANLMAGNGVLLKHAENVTGSALLLQKIYEEAGLPKNLFSVLIIDHEQSDEIIKNDLVRGVTLTGSPKAGKIVAEKAAAVLKKTVLELGSNDAYIVFDDADLELAVQACVTGRIYNNGETCVAAKRFIVVEERYDDFKKAFIKAMRDVKMGDPTDESTDFGPMARKDLRDKLHDQVIESVEKGATVLLGGTIPEKKGFFYPATILENIEPGQPAYDDELFGPVASLIKAKNNHDALKIANDSKYGLGGGIFSKNEEKAFEMAKKYFDTGMVFINSFGLAQPNMPFGGVKESGYGREHGGFGIREFVNAKSVMKVKM
ncbi:NAD-dependent succinate-semialdehyde dehydrogenase [Cytophaga sp. FL35]|uniref:NAD-dependent succinate-semialdehyde dehydrogenase n=1 Tax=Cytophaga sp. FL35 TaxID=1904456 RepID=UPI00165396E1|nr:NAD-dependent succinate-semialdehyde dehydrogenase [Cytophaga sp. FL35]MBC6998308.1 NAD-dependent succinate-semialdehyde dehydrogenase [Cytophaga sp. FL35]